MSRSARQMLLGISLGALYIAVLSGLVMLVALVSQQ